jgi:hypothetical protein
MPELGRQYGGRTVMTQFSLHPSPERDICQAGSAIAST